MSHVVCSLLIIIIITIISFIHLFISKNKILITLCGKLWNEWHLASYINIFLHFHSIFLGKPEKDNKFNASRNDINKNDTKMQNHRIHHRIHRTPHNKTTNPKFPTSFSFFIETIIPWWIFQHYARVRLICHPDWIHIKYINRIMWKKIVVLTNIDFSVSPYSVYGCVWPEEVDVIAIRFGACAFLHTTHNWRNVFCFSFFFFGFLFDLICFHLISSSLRMQVLLAVFAFCPQTKSKQTICILYTVYCIF